MSQYLHAIALQAKRQTQIEPIDRDSKRSESGGFQPIHQLRDHDKPIGRCTNPVLRELASSSGHCW